MPGLINRIKEFSQSPQGRKAVDSARRAAADPRKRAQALRMLRRLRGRR